MALNVADLFIPKFDRIFESAMDPDGGSSEYWMEGGRGSTKSSFVSIAIVLIVRFFPFANAVVFRRYGNTLRDTVYEQVLWAIHVLGLDDSFAPSKSPLEIVYRPTGQKISFKGLDDPKKRKGAKFHVGYCAAAWFEEIDELNSWDDVSSTLRTFRRGGSRFWTFYTYNPPKTLWSWVNRKSIEMRSRDGVVVDHSTYEDVVAAGHASWLGESFLADAEYERVAHPLHYRWEFLGEATGTGGSVFENIVEREITDEEVLSFDNPRVGVDFGWFPDPWRLVQCEWQPGQRRLVIWGERSANRATPRETGQIIREAQTYGPAGGERFHDDPIWCDEADVTQIGVYRRECGLNARKADKGGMRKASYEWLAGLREIVIDPRRTPLAYEEFRLCEYARDRDGNWVDDYCDGNDHCIDAVRYAVMNDVRRGR